MISDLLGPLLVLTDRTQCARPLPDVVRAAVDGGARTVVLREKDLPGDDRRRLADALRPLLPADGVLVLAGPPPAADAVHPGVADAVHPGVADAVHLGVADAVPDPRPPLLGRSCHTPAEVAAAHGCDWVTASPVRLTASKPGYGPALGVDGLAACVLAPGAPPVYALGGLGRTDAAACLRAGAVGLAVMGGVMRAARPDVVVAELLTALAPGGTA